MKAFYDVGYTVVAVASDCGGGSVGDWKQVCTKLEINSRKNLNTLSHSQILKTKWNQSKTNSHKKYELISCWKMKMNYDCHVKKRKSFIYLNRVLTRFACLSIVNIYSVCIVLIKLELLMISVKVLFLVIAYYT